MKLIFCTNCQDVFKLTTELRQCSCLECGGYYVDKLNVEYWGASAISLEFDNTSFIEAICNRPLSGMGKCFEAFVIPVECSTFIRRA